MFWYYYESPEYLIFMILSLIFSMYAHFKIKFTFKKYSKINCKKNFTGLDAAKRVLQQNNVNGVEVNHVFGDLTDHFDPRTNKIFLSNNVYDKNSIAAIGVAAHEAGHAVQYAKAYMPIKIRQKIIPICQFGSNLSMPLIFLGLILPNLYFMAQFGILLFSTIVLFQLVTLPVEIDASKRALNSLQEYAILDSEELVGAKKVLLSAALTYVAAAFSSIVSLLRMISIVNSNKDSH